MLRVNNKTISFAKGENVAFSVEIIDGDGQPFIFPTLKDNEIGYEKFLLFSVVNEYGEKVIEKKMDISGPINYLGSDGEIVTDNSSAGYAKFSTQTVLSTTNVNDCFGYSKTSNGNGTIGTATQRSNRTKVAKHNNKYFCWCSNTTDAKSDDGEPAIYKFIFTLSLAHEDTINLRVREYKYDLTAYIKSPHETVWKRQLIAPSTLKLEDTNNGY